MGPNIDFGSCTVHSFNESQDDEAEPKMGRRVNEKLVNVGSHEPALESSPFMGLFYNRD